MNPTIFYPGYVSYGFSELRYELYETGIQRVDISRDWNPAVVALTRSLNFCIYLNGEVLKAVEAPFRLLEDLALLLINGVASVWKPEYRVNLIQVGKNLWRDILLTIPVVWFLKDPVFSVIGTIVLINKSVVGLHSNNYRTKKMNEENANLRAFEQHHPTLFPHIVAPAVPHPAVPAAPPHVALNPPPN